MKLAKLLTTILLIIAVFVPVGADENTYEVKDNNSGFSIGFETYDEALEFYDDNVDEYDNLLLLENGNVANMEYGIVELVGNDNIVEYHSILRDTNDYISGQYGVDAAFLYIKDSKVYFKVSGDIGYTDINNVILHPYEELDVNISSYVANGGYLYHNIKTQLKYENYSISLCIDEKPSFMKDNASYFSYDGHYFYDDFYLMIDDYRNESYESATNNEPYYNYYQYLPYRSITRYTCEEISDYFKNVLGINGGLTHYYDLNGDGASDEVNRSQFYNNFNTFFAMEQMYGTNALMLISSGIVESSYGKSLNSYLKNSLYTNSAFESEHEQANNRYDSIANSIYSYAKFYISKLYSNHLRNDYYGTNFGNKLSGINIEYSIDHYFGEKCASEYFKLDNALGLKDKNKYAIAIIDDLESLTLYSDASLEKKIVKLSNTDNLAFSILADYEESYKVQLDSSFNDDYIYDFLDSVGYIDKDAVKYIINEDDIKLYEFNKINYDFNGGEYYGYDKLSVRAINNNPVIVPNKEGYEFVDYSSDINEDGKLTYTANYKEIKSISVSGLLDVQRKLLPYPDLTGSRINVKYTDGSHLNTQINTDNIGYYNLNDDEPQEISISYCGAESSKQIQIDMSYYDIYDSIEEAIDEEDYEFVRSNIGNVRYPLSMSEIRKIDSALKDNYKRNYVIKDVNKDRDVSISGLDLSLETKHNFSLIEDTYYVNIKDISNINKTRILDVASGYGFEDVLGINISFKFNFQTIDLDAPAIVQINIPDKKDDYIYSVYHINDNGDVIKCRTTQSNNYIQFIIDETGDYEVLCMPSFNTYDIDDGVENLSYENMGVDNNRINLEFMLGLAIIFVALIGILIYYRVLDVKEKQWKDYRKSLLKVDTVQEEKQKS